MSRHRRRRGLSLIEIVVVITILSILTTAVAVYAIGIASDSKVKIAKNELETIGQALDTYFALTGRYPTDAEGLKPLLERKILKHPALDPWGRAFEYRLVQGAPTLTSLGADGATGGTGDASDLVWPTE